jgi:predicted AlkP superfamily pyrophosphatase or phosphodiesterase
LSVTDGAGHTFGPQSVEIEDIYLRLDRNLEVLVKFLDDNIGKEEYLLFLTSDHGVLPVASYLRDHKLPADVARTKAQGIALSTYLKSVYGDHPWISYFQEDQIYLNRNLIEERKLDLGSVQQKVADFMTGQEGVHTAITAYDLRTQEYTYGMNRLLQNGYYGQRSGDVLLTFDSGIVQNANPEIEVSKVKGTTHGTGYAYDRHVPMLWYGFGIPKGESIRPVAPIDIAPSLAMFLNLQLPSASTGEPLKELFQ